MSRTVEEFKGIVFVGESLFGCEEGGMGEEEGQDVCSGEIAGIGVFGWRGDYEK